MKCGCWRSFVYFTLIILVSVISASEPQNQTNTQSDFNNLRRWRRSDEGEEGSFSWRDVSPRLDNRVITRDSEFVNRRRKKCNNRFQIENGRRRILEQGSLVRFRCEYGYILFGATVAACVRGQWSEPPPVCISAGCRRPQLPQGIIGRPLFGGAAIIFECFPGYQMEGESTLVCNGLRWNGTIPTCTKITTPTPTTTTAAITTTMVTIEGLPSTSEPLTTEVEESEENIPFPLTHEPQYQGTSTAEALRVEPVESSTWNDWTEANSEKPEVNSFSNLDKSVTDKLEIFPAKVTELTTEGSEIKEELTSSTVNRIDQLSKVTTTTPYTTTTTKFPVTVEKTTTANSSSKNLPVATSPSAPETPPAIVTTNSTKTTSVTTARTVNANNTYAPNTNKFVAKSTMTTPAPSTGTEFLSTAYKPSTSRTMNPRLTTNGTFNNVTIKVYNSTRNPKSNATRGAMILCAYLYRTPKQKQQLWECLHYHLNSTSNPSRRVKPTPRNRFVTARNRTTQLITGIKNVTRSRPAIMQTTPQVFETTKMAQTSKMTSTIKTTEIITTSTPSRAIRTGSSTTIAVTTVKISSTTKLNQTDYSPSRNEEFDNTIEQVLRRPKESEKIVTHVEEKREFITPYKLDTAVQGTESTKGANMFATLSTLVALTAITMLGVIFYYCWRRNKGIARRSRYESDGRNLSAHLDMEEEFVYFGNNR